MNLAQECYYLENKVGVVDFTKARGLAKFQSPQALVHHGEPLGFKTLPFLGHLQNLLLPLYFRGNVSFLPKKTPPRFTVITNGHYDDSIICIRFQHEIVIRD